MDPGQSGLLIAVIVTHDRPALQRRCLASVAGQELQPDAILVIDDASAGPATEAAMAAFPQARHIRHHRRCGGATAYRTGVE